MTLLLDLALQMAPRVQCDSQRALGEGVGFIRLYLVLAEAQQNNTSSPQNQKVSSDPLGSFDGCCQMSEELPACHQEIIIY